MKLGQVKTFSYDVRGYADIKAKIDADVSTWVAATAPTAMDPAIVQVGERNAVVVIMYSTGSQL